MAGERLTLGATRPVARAGAAEGRRRRSSSETIRTEFGTFGRQVSGYSLEHLLPENGFDVATFMAGTEGTLATLTSATVRLVEDPAHRLMLVLGYGSMAEAADDVPGLLGFGRPRAKGSTPASSTSCATTAAPCPTCPRGQGWLFVEISGADEAEIADTVDKAAAASSALDSRVVTDPREQAVLWRIREEGAGLATRTLPRKALSGWEDAAVPPERLGTYLREQDVLLAEYGLDGVPYGHFGDGCVHIRIDFPLDDPGGHDMFRNFLVEAATLVSSLGGSLSGEHGDGRARSELLPLMYSDKAIDLFAQVKGVFDPDDLLNPGVLVRPSALDADLRGPESIAGGASTAARAAPPPRRRRLRQGCPPLHRCRQVPRRQPRFERCHVSVVPGDPRREGLDPRPSAGAAGDDRRPSRHRWLAFPGGARGPRSLPVLQGLRQRLSYRHRHGDLQVRGAAPVVQGTHSAAQPLPPRPAPVVGAPDVSVRVSGQHRLQHAGCPVADAMVRRRRPASQPADVRARQLQSLGPQADRRRPDERPGVLLWVDSFTDYFTTDGARPRSRFWSQPATGSSSSVVAPAVVSPGSRQVSSTRPGLDRRDGRQAAPVRRRRHPDRRARAVVPGRAAIRRRRAARRPSCGRRRTRSVHLGRAATTYGGVAGPI